MQPKPRRARLVPLLLTCLIVATGAFAAGQEASTQNARLDAAAQSAPAELQLRRSAVAVSPGPSSVAAADFNGDGVLDLVAASWGYWDSDRQRAVGGDAITVSLGDGYGSFGESARLAAGKSPRSLIAGDFNGDGAPDFATANQSGRSVSVFIHTTGSQFTRTDYAFEGDPIALAAGDFDGDGFADLAVGGYSSTSVVLLFGSPSGAMTRKAPLRAAPRGVISLTAADFDLDGNLDLMSGGDEGVALLRGRGDGTFQSPATVWNHARAYSLVATDLDGDSRPDLAFVTFQPDAVYTLLNAGHGQFVPSGPVFEGSPLSVAAADLNLDGRVDLAVAEYTGNVHILLGDGDGAFHRATTVHSGPYPFWIIAAQLNQDERPDLVAANIYASYLTLLLNQPPLFVETPNRPANWGIGSTQRLAWSYAGRARSFLLEISRDGTRTWEPLTTNPVPNRPGRSQSFYWTVSGPASSQARFRVSAVGDSEAVDVNDAPISIQAAFLRFRTPQGGSDVGIGSTQRITLDHNLSSRVPLVIERSDDGGRTWTEVARSETTGSETANVSWKVAAPVAPRVILRARALDGSDAIATTHSFSVSPPRLEITAPAPGFTVRECGVITVHWTSNLGLEPLRAEVVSAAHVTGSVTIEHAGAKGTASLYVSGPQGAEFRLRLIAPGFANVQAMTGPGHIAGQECDDGE